MRDVNIEMLVFEIACFTLEFAAIVASVALASEGKTNWALAFGATAVVAGYAEGRFVGWARERYPQYFD